MRRRKREPHFLRRLSLLKGLPILRISDAAPFVGDRIEFRDVAGEHVSAVAGHRERRDTDVVELGKPSRVEWWPILALRQGHEPPDGGFPPIRVEESPPACCPQFSPRMERVSWPLEKSTLKRSAGSSCSSE